MTRDQFNTATHKTVVASRHMGRRIFAVITDKPEYDFSTTKVMAISVVFMVLHVAEETHNFSVTMVTLIIAAFAVGFGKSTFSFFLAREQQKAELAKDKG